MPNNNNSDLNNISLDQNTNNTLEIQETNSNDTSTPTDVYFNIIENNTHGFVNETKGNFTIFYYHKGYPLLMIGPHCKYKIFKTQ